MICKLDILGLNVKRRRENKNNFIYVKKSDKVDTSCERTTLRKYEILTTIRTFWDFTILFNKNIHKPTWNSTDDIINNNWIKYVTVWSGWEPCLLRTTWEKCFVCELPYRKIVPTKGGDENMLRSSAYNTELESNIF